MVFAASCDEYFDRAGQGSQSEPADACCAPCGVERDRAGFEARREITDHHIFMKRIEVDKTAGLEGAALRDYYIWYV